jgi:CBS domain containing-hemolysin-like protein
MTPSLAASVPLLIVLVVLIALAAFLGAAEAALLRVPRVRAEVMADAGDRAARRVSRLVDDLTHTMNAVLLLVLLLQVSAATIAGIVAERHFGNTGVTIGSVVLTLVMFVYAEAIPKTLAVRRPMQVARWVALPVSWLVKPVQPIVWLLVRFADLQAPGRGVETGLTVTEAEIIALAAAAEAEGAIEHSDRDLIERAFVVGDTKINEILIPRGDVVAVDAATPVREALEMAVAAGHQRLPVYEGDLDRVTGVVRIRDLAGAAAETQELSVGALATDLPVVLEWRRAIGVLRDLQRKRKSMAVVLDEFGGTAGIVTVEDIVAELVGEIGEDDTTPVPEIQILGEGHWAVLGSADVRDLSAALGASLPHGDWTTAAGMVIGQAGRIPAQGDVIVIGGYRYTIASATRRRVRRLEITGPAR